MLRRRGVQMKWDYKKNKNELLLTHTDAAPQ